MKLEGFGKKQKKSRIEFKKGENYNIPRDSMVTLIDLKNKVIVKNSWRRPKNLSRYRRKDREHYVDRLTGEEKEYQKRIFKSDKTIRKNMKNLKELVNLNFGDGENNLFLTLTYSYIEMNLEKIKKDVKLFLRRLKNHYPNSDFAYIAKFERGTENMGWHSHILLKDKNKKELFIPNTEIQKIWRKGFTKTQRVYEKKIKLETANNNSAEFTIADYMAKTSQLYDVPNGKSVYIPSKNIQRPKKTKILYEQAREIIDQEYYLANEITLNVCDKIENKIVNVHKKEIYRKKKK